MEHCIKEIFPGNTVSDQCNDILQKSLDLKVVKQVSVVINAIALLTERHSQIKVQ